MTLTRPLTYPQGAGFSVEKEGKKASPEKTPGNAAKRIDFAPGERENRSMGKCAPDSAGALCPMQCFKM